MVNASVPAGALAFLLTPNMILPGAHFKVCHICPSTSGLISNV